jgi:hypothetical protein
VIFLTQSGGPSQLELFDHKPDLVKHAGTELPASVRMGQRLTGMTANQKQIVMPSRCAFRQYGQSGATIGEWLPYMGRVADEICFIKSMTSEHINHAPAMTFLQTGHQLPGRPSIGAWVSYGLGTENSNLPSFVVIAPKSPYAGGQVWASDFLPGAHQGTWVVPGQEPVANLRRRSPSEELQALEMAAMNRMNLRHRAARSADPLLAARMKSFETAFGMQMELPELFDLSRESDATHALYGLERGSTRGFGWQCLVARRLAERGVRFIELIDSGSSDNWDAHGDMTLHSPLAANVDRPIAGLLNDLRQRGMLEDTLVVWTSEFGRTPFNATADHRGREHHHWVFSSWMAGAGVKAGTVYGASDDLGIRVATNRVHVHDFHATILHLLGFDHERLTHHHNGRDYRLTDVAGEVVKGVLA